MTAKIIPNDRMRDYFLVWQCRIRQIAMREQAGRPTPGMQPSVTIQGDRMISDAITTLLIPRDPTESTAFFRFQVRKYRDPKDVYEKGLQYLQSTHFQGAGSYSDRLTAIFAPNSLVARQLLLEGHCLLRFGQFSQSFNLSCDVTSLEPSDPAYQASLWHNRLFNPQLPDGVQVLAFKPDWASAQADPAPGGQ